VSHRIPSVAEALKFIEKHGVVLESAHGPVPTFVDFVAGEPIARWWDHPLGRSIFRLTRAVRDSPDVVTARLIDGKITYLHRRIWPALVKLSNKMDKKNLAAIREEHLPSGKHRTVTTRFPRWVPSDVLTMSKQLSESEAKSLFPKLKL